MSYHEFLNTLQKRGSKPHKLTHCLGVRDAWKWVRKNKWKALKGNKCSSADYGTVINEVNKILIERLLEGHSIVLPHQMGTLKLTAVNTKISYKDGKLQNNYRTDWKKTLEYWYEDNEAYKEKKRIKRIQKLLYSIKYIKNSARYKNQMFYQFRVNRGLVRTLGNKIENEKLNALIY